MSLFQLRAPYEPQGDQPRAIQELAEGIARGTPRQTLLGVTGSGKTFTLANLVARVGRPTLVISHNKTLAAQLYGEFRAYFPESAVEYFVSYYDYYQPEAYLPATDTYIEKDASINDDLDRLRLRATSAVLSRPDVIVVASVSCIYGIGSSRDFLEMLVRVRRGETRSREEFLRALVAIQYVRNDVDPPRGSIRVRGDTVEVRPAGEETALRVEFFGDEVERIAEVDPTTGRALRELPEAVVFPAKHFVTPHRRLPEALAGIRRELGERLGELRAEGKLLEAQRLESRTLYDLEMMREVGYCAGIENYSRHLSGRGPGEPPDTLLGYFPREALIVIDESHVTLPQLRGMYRGDRSRKETLVAHGFRLPSALDNRPLRFEEFVERIGQTIFVSATPGDYELAESGGVVVEQLIRPTGLVDPEVSVRPVAHQMDDLLEEIRGRVARGERVLVTTLTKRMAEDLTEYLQELGVRVRYLHSDIDTIERVEILRGLRLGEFDVLVGINLLREGLDLPEVSLVAILDADQEGFLRSETSLIQTAGRAARNVAGTVILYADRMTGSMERALAETGRRREVQLAYNREHGITPRTVVKSREEILRVTSVADSRQEERPEEAGAKALLASELAALDPPALVAEMEREMLAAADRLEFELAASLRDRIEELELEHALAAPARGASRKGGKKRPRRAASGSAARATRGVRRVVSARGGRKGGR